MAANDSPGASARKFPARIVFYAIPLIFWLQSAVQGFQGWLDRLFGTYIPELCILIVIAVLTVTLELFVALKRKKPSIIEVHNLYAVPKGTFKRKAMTIALCIIIPFGVIATIVAWQRHYCFPGTGADISIYIDEASFQDSPYPEITTEIKTALRRTLGDALPHANVDILPSPPAGIRGLEERLAWACGGGATLVMYGNASEHKVWPHVRICSDKVQPAMYENWDTETSMGEITDRQIQYGTLLPQHESLKLCFIDSLVKPRSAYLALLSVGLVLLYDDVPQLSNIDELRKADQLLSKAVEMESTRGDCRLGYCEALHYGGVVKMTLAEKQGDMKMAHAASEFFSQELDLRPDYPEAMEYLAQAMVFCARSVAPKEADSLVRTALMYFEECKRIDSAYEISAEGMNNWGVVLVEYAARLPRDSAISAFESAFEKFDSATVRERCCVPIWRNWGYALLAYARKLSGTEAVEALKQASEKFAIATTRAPKNRWAHYGWGTALLERAKASDDAQEAGLIADSACLMFEKAVHIDSNFYSAYNNWGVALSHRASLVERDAADSLYEEAYLKFARAIEIKPDYVLAYRIWGYTLGVHARRATDHSARALYDECCAKCQEAVRLEPNDAATYGVWGDALVGVADLSSGPEAERAYEMALEKYATAVSKKNDFIEAYNQSGLVSRKYASISDGTKAADLFRYSFEMYHRALCIRPGDRIVILNWSYSLLEFSKLDPAAKSYDRVKSCHERLEATLKSGQEVVECGLYSILCDMLSLVPYQDSSMIKYRETLLARCVAPDTTHNGY